MNTKDLLCFLEVCQEGSISKAAQKLYMTPQGLSKIIKNLEDEIGVTLFIRTSSGANLTFYGKEFEKSANELIERLESIKNIFSRELDNRHGILKIGCALGIISALSLDYFFRFNENYPNINVQISEYTDLDVEESVLNADVDIGLAVEPVDRTKFHVIPFSYGEHCVVIHKSHPLAVKKSISLLDLKDEKIILESKKFKVYLKFINYCKVMGFEPSIYFETTEISLAHKLAHLNKGIAISVVSATEDIIYDDVVVLPFEEKFLWEWCVISKINESLTPISREFLKYLGLRT